MYWRSHSRKVMEWDFIDSSWMTKRDPQFIWCVCSLYCENSENGRLAVVRSHLDQVMVNSLTKQDFNDWWIGLSLTKVNCLSTLNPCLNHMPTGCLVRTFILITAWKREITWSMGGSIYPGSSYLLVKRSS